MFALAAVLTVLAGAGWYFARESAGHRIPPPAPAEPLRLRRAPHDSLIGAAERVDAYARSEFVPTPPAQGDWVHVWTEQWARDGDGGISPRQIQLLRAPDGSGHEYTWILPAVPAEDFRLAMVGSTRFRLATMQRTDYGPGQITSHVDNPSNDPVRLLNQLHDIEPSSNGAPGVLRAISSLWLYSCPGTGVRAAILRLLAGIEGLTINDHAIDDIGRPGYAITAATESSTDTMFVDPNTGMFMQLRQTYTVAGQRPAVHQYLIYKSCGYSSDTEPAVIA
ncbi:MAG TPA: hypothetical protein DGT23_30125 [Micromonosporaceae bacterium]|nr:hypothetical protein [Micromonosporaceae bacterium]